MANRTITDDTTLAALIDGAAECHQDKIAVTAPLRPSLSYLDLQKQTTEMREQLHECGIHASHKVAVVLPNGPEMATAVLGAASTAICAPLNPSYGEREFRFYLDDLQPEALLVPGDYTGPANLIADELGIRRIGVHWKDNWPAGRFELNGDRSAQPIEASPIKSEDIALVLHTSGTTSRPKVVPISHGNLHSSAHNVARSLGLSAGDRCLNVMPLFHIHGLVAALLAPLASGGSVACTGGYKSDQFIEWLQLLEPTWLTAVPTIHQAICADLAGNKDFLRSSKLRFVRSSSAALPPAVARAVKNTLGVPVIEAYGMTEAAHQIASNPLPPGEAKPQSVGLPAGPEIAIMGEDGQLAPAGETAEIVIRGDNVISGYENNPEANAGAFEFGWFRTGDQGHIDEDGYLFITGRLKEIINRGGEKVAPSEVDAALLEHPAVQEAVSFSVQHASLGEDVAAVVVLKDGATATSTEVRHFLFDRLSEFKVPNRIVIVDEIPKGATGKIQRIGLEETLAGQLDYEFVAPKNKAETAVAKIFASILGIDQVGALDNFFSIGGDSLRGFQVLARIRAEFGVDLPIPELFREPTVAELAASIERHRELAEVSAIERALDDIENLTDEEVSALLVTRDRDSST
ncbi:MAG: non-ribosomal peptide synthetase [Gammaproteobacteria bacterium]